jgi:hypothetical protein
MDETVRSEIVGTTGLILAACIALFLTWRRIPKAARPEDSRRTVLTFVGLLCQSIHFAEEYATGFYHRFSCDQTTFRVSLEKCSSNSVLIIPSSLKLAGRQPIPH